jgi:hypothetical protein
MRICLTVFLSLFFLNGFAQTLTTRFERSNGTETPTYQEIIQWWKAADKQSPRLKLLTMGPTDAGYPLHLAVLTNDGNSDLALARKNNKRIILVNNGIHPGEPDGIDASMLLVRDIITGKKTLPSNIVLAIIPVYNIGGCLNRSEWFRVDQNGPKAFGSRGNSQNLDLNRDFIKNDSREAKSFASIFHLCDPDIFIDNHVSNGADYQHVMTLISTQHNILGGAMGKYLEETLEPAIYTSMKEKGYDLVPYVNNFDETPESGWPQFVDAARFSTGYASLWQTFSFMPETHMLKPYKQRVEATYALMESFITYTSKNSQQIRDLRAQSKKAIQTQPQFAVNWKVDSTKFKQIIFKGFEAGHKPSEVSGLTRLYYDRNKPFEKKVRFYHEYKASQTVSTPSAYIIPQGWWKVIDLLKLNEVKMQRLSSDTSIEVEYYRINSYKSSPRPYEQHHLNSAVQLTANKKKMQFRKGDYIIPMNQVANRFLIEVLEPQSTDSYFAWNYFDAVLQQKEGYSDYVFEETAAEYLQKDPALNEKLKQQQSADSSFAKSASAQLDFIYENSPWYEPAHMIYPVYRITK